MMDINKAFTTGALPFSGTGQGGIIPDSLQKGLEALTHDTMQALAAFQSQAVGTAANNAQGTGWDNTSLINNANGAPKLGDITINFSADDFAAALVTLQGKTQDAQLTTAKEGLKANNKKVEDQRQRSLDKIKEWADKCKAADAKAKSGAILGWFKKIATVVAAVFATAVATIATFATGGAAAPLLALAVLGMAAAITGLASDISKATGGKGCDGALQWMDPGSLVGKLASFLAKEVFHASDAQAGIAATVFSIATTACIMVASILLTGGSNIASSIAKMTERLTSIMSKAIKFTMDLSKVATPVAGIVTGLTDVAQGGFKIAGAYDTRAASNLQADKVKIDAILAKLQQQMEEGRDDIKKVMDEIMEGMSIVSQMIAAAGASRSQITSNMAGKGQII